MERENRIEEVDYRKEQAEKTRAGKGQEQEKRQSRRRRRKEDRGVIYFL